MPRPAPQQLRCPPPTIDLTPQTQLSSITGAVLQQLQSTQQQLQDTQVRPEWLYQKSVCQSAAISHQAALASHPPLICVMQMADGSPVRVPVWKQLGSQCY